MKGLNMNKQDTVSISRSKYEELIRRSNKLEALEQAGVDNWDGYEDAMDLLEEWQDSVGLDEEEEEDAI
jgi:hypothetical protein